MLINRKDSDRAIGIITLSGDFNYGNKLQLFATSNIYRSLGYRPIYLSFNHKEPLAAHPKRLLKSVVRGKETESVYPFLDARGQAFSRFGAGIETRKILSVVDVCADEFSYFAVGSDQVWNPCYAWQNSLYSGIDRAYHAFVDPHARKESLDWFFLRFARREQRLTTAPSIGLDTLNSRQSKWLAEGLSGFNNLSIREARGAEIIEELTGKKALVVCDPTLAVPKPVWLEVSNDEVTPREPYVFSYVLGSHSGDYEKVIHSASRGGELPVVSLSDRNDEGEPGAGPAEFISLISHASHVVTDSFHASVFSAIMETPLTIIQRADGGGSMFSRLTSLSEALGIQGKIYDGKDIDFSVASDYENVAEAIERQRSAFMEYLKGCLND